MEQVVLGSSEMLFVDLLFQQSLVRVVRQYDFSTASNVAPILAVDEIRGPAYLICLTRSLSDDAVLGALLLHLSWA